MKYAVVTGSTKGIGKAIAIKLLNEGYFVIVNYANDESAATAFSDEVAEYRGQFAIIKCELSSYENAQEFMNKIGAITQNIDCLILNSGVTDRSLFHEITQADWEHVINTNLNVPFYLVQGLCDKITTDCGRIIFIASILGKYPHAMSLSYAVSKAGVIQMMRNLVKEFSSRRITVNAVLPGFVDTSWQLNKTVEQRKRIEDKIALHRFAQPNEIADLCWSVINNQYINGSELYIDGGYSFK